MKYNDFKIFKFSTISKNIDRIGDNLPGIHKKIKTILNKAANFLSYILKYVFSDIKKSIKFIINEFLKIYKSIDLRRSGFKKFYKHLDIRRYDFYKINKKITLTKYKYATIYFVVFAILMGFVYLIIPKFYSYDKLKIAKTVCNNQNVECLIKGKIYYSFYPTPRIKIKDLIINGHFKKKDTLVTVRMQKLCFLLKIY